MSVTKVGNVMNSRCNKTHLDIEKADERGIIHRDYLAHSLRWTHVLKYARRGCNILDVGCANGMLAQVLYVNKLNPNYIGLDIRENMLKVADARKLNREQEFYQMDLTKTPFPVERGWANVTVCFEVVEHIMEESLDFLLQQIEAATSKTGIILLSTPNYDGVHEAANHIKEYREHELQEYLEKYFEIKAKFGTFASQSDIVKALSVEERTVYYGLKNYYDSNVLSLFFAPLHPSESRNILWVLKRRS